MKISQYLRGDAAQRTQDVLDEAAIEAGMAEKAAEFRAQGAEIHRPA